MPNLRNASIRAKINRAFDDCMSCTNSECEDCCWEATQTELDDIIDELRDKWLGNKMPIIRCPHCGTADNLSFDMDDWPWEEESHGNYVSKDYTCFHCGMEYSVEVEGKIIDVEVYKL